VFDRCARGPIEHDGKFSRHHRRGQSEIPRRTLPPALKLRQSRTPEFPDFVQRYARL
jgi:hypothetical protein